MPRMSDVLDRLSHFPVIMRQLNTLRGEMELLATESPHATLVQTWCAYGCDADRYLPLSLMPILRGSELYRAIAVGWHRVPAAIEVPEGTCDHAGRLLVGQLVHAVKQYDEYTWAAASEDIQSLGHLAACALASTRFANNVDLLVAMPSSRGTNSLPFQVVKDLAFLTRIPHASADSITFTRAVPQLKAIDDYWDKRKTLHRSMIARPEEVRGRNVLVVDDVCRSGATLHECARACTDAGAASVTALAVSKTFEFQRIPFETMGYSTNTSWEDGDPRLL